MNSTGSSSAVSVGLSFLRSWLLFHSAALLLLLLPISIAISKKPSVKLPGAGSRGHEHRSLAKHAIALHHRDPLGGRGVGGLNTYNKDLIKPI